MSSASSLSARSQHPLGPAVVADQRLVEAVGLEVPELLRRRLLRAVAAVAEEGDVVGAGPAQVAAEGGDHGLPGGLLVEQRLNPQRLLDRAPARVDPGPEVGVHLAGVVGAAAEPGDGRRVVVDADEQGVDVTGHEGGEPRCIQTSGASP